MAVMLPAAKVPGAYLGRERMAANGAHSLYRLLADARFAFLYRGTFHESLAPELIVLGEVAAEQAGHGKAHRQRLAFIMVEAFQNITRHRSEAVDADCFFGLRATAVGEDVFAVNPVRAEEVAPLEQAIARLNSTGAGSLKSLFLSRLRDGGHSAKGGAGLGLIEMARRSGNGIRHRIQALGPGHAQFALHVPLGDPIDGAFEECLEIHRCARADQVIIGLRCGGSLLAQDAALRVLDRELAGDVTVMNRAKRAVLAAFSWVKASGLVTDSLILVGGGPRDRWVEICWSPSGNAEEDIGDRVRAVCGLSPFELDRRYRLAVRGASDAVHADEGLIELARIGTEPMSYSRAPAGECDSLRVML